MSKSTASGTDTTAGHHASFGREARAWLCDLGDVVARCVVEDNGLYPVFHGCYDWHSAVHGVWALHVIARLTGDTGYLDTANRVLRPEAVASEVAAMRAGELDFEVPYGVAWVLALVRERRLAGRTDLETLGVEAAARLRVHVEALSASQITSGVCSDDYENLPWAVLNLWQWACHAGDASLRSWVEAFTRTELLSRVSFCPLQDDLRAGSEFFAPGLNLALVLVSVLPSSELTEWVETLPERYPIRPLTSFETVHSAGLNFSRSWGLHALFHATGDPAYALASQEHLRVHYGMPRVWRRDFVSYAHWVPQFGVYGIALWMDQR